MLNLYNGKCYEGVLYGVINNDKCFKREVHGIKKTWRWGGDQGRMVVCQIERHGIYKIPLVKGIIKHLKS